MRVLLASLVLLCSIGGAALAGKRALLVGINKYVPPAGMAADRARAWTSLEGAVNDTRDVRDLLIKKYRFSPQEIRVLNDDDATRDRIEQGIRDYLGKDVKRGDIRFFYFAGHGSQVPNSLSEEPDKLDEVVVASDIGRNRKAYLRDKELRRLFTPIAQAGAQLVMIFDSCHSGSVTRGYSPGRARLLPLVDAEDVKDPTDKTVQAPEDVGALRLSAAQDYQAAFEAPSRGATQEQHGNFTLALLETLWASPTESPIDEVFVRTRAVMTREGHSQEPVLAGSPERARRGLFGGPKDKARRGTAVGVIGVEGKEIILDGGWLQGLAPGTELCALRDDKVVEGVRVRVDTVDGPSKSHGALIHGIQVRHGELLQVVKWTVEDEPSLKLYLPPALDPEATLAAAKTLSALASSTRLTLGGDPADAPPSHVLAWDGKAWVLGDGTRSIATVDVGQTSEIERLVTTTFSPRRDKTGHKLEDKPSLMLIAPPSPLLVSAILGWNEVKDGVIARVGDPAQAHYSLVGRVSDGRIQHAFARPLWSAGAAGSLPARTEWIPAGATNESAVTSTPDPLQEKARILARVRSWLVLGKPGSGDEGFPYHLELRRLDRHAAAPLRGAEGEVAHGGEQYEMVLVADPRKLAGAEARHVYLFVIDDKGCSQLVFPRAGEDNYLPRKEIPPPQMTWPVPKSSFAVGAPYGVDAYFLLATSDPVTDPGAIFNWDAARSRDAEARGEEPGGPGAAITRLLRHVGARGSPPDAPQRWSLQRLFVRSEAGK